MMVRGRSSAPPWRRFRCASNQSHCSLAGSAVSTARFRSVVLRPQPPLETLATPPGCRRRPRPRGRRPAEYLWGAAWCLHRKDDPAAESWVAVHALALLGGQVTRAITTITGQAADLTGTRRHGIDTCLEYLTAKAAYLHYDQALEVGWPIATGVIEGACRHLVADRLDIAGS